MIEGKRMIRWKWGAKNRGRGQREKLEGKRVGEENDEEERRGEVIGVCLCTYVLLFFHLYLTQLMLVQTKRLRGRESLV